MEVFATLQEGGPVGLGRLHQRALKQTGIQSSLREKKNLKQLPASTEGFVLDCPNREVLPRKDKFPVSEQSTKKLYSDLLKP